MTKLDLKTLDTALEARASELARSLAGRHRITIEPTADAFDEALLAAARECSAQTLEQDFRLLCEVKAARDRIREGAFGICVSCQESIALKRLNAIPWAACCVSCQQAREEEEGAAPSLLRAA